MGECRYNVDTGGDDDMKTVVKKWGNSASVRIPAAVMQAARLKLDEAVDVREESGRIVIEPAQRKEYDLGELLKGITRENLHGEADFGRPVGKEAW
jgi:antitoxin MazE